MTKKTMKKMIFLTGIITLLSTSAFAQFEDNKWVLGGSVSTHYNNSGGADATSTVYNISLIDGYVLNESSVIGLITAFSNSSTESLSVNSTSSSFSFLAGIVYRKYWTLKENLYFFSQGHLAYTGGDTEISATGSESSFSLSGLNASISPGISVRLTSWLLVDLSLGGLNYSKVTSTNDEVPENQTSNSQFSFVLNRPSLGVIYSF